MTADEIVVKEYPYISIETFEYKDKAYLRYILVLSEGFTTPGVQDDVNTGYPRDYYILSEHAKPLRELDKCKVENYLEEAERVALNLSIPFYYIGCTRRDLIKNAKHSLFSLSMQIYNNINIYHDSPNEKTWDIIVADVEVLHKRLKNLCRTIEWKKYTAFAQQVTLETNEEMFTGALIDFNNQLHYFSDRWSSSRYKRNLKLWKYVLKLKKEQP